MTFNEIKAIDNEYIAGTYGRFDICITSGNGASCVDAGGNEYIDFTSGIGVNSLGFCNTGWANAVSKQAAMLNHTSNLYYTEPAAVLAQELCKKSGFCKVFFANSGAEANEGAIKAARKYSCDKYGEGRNEIITLVNSFHGRTVTTLAATGQDSFHQHFAPFTGGFVFAKANNINEVQAAVGAKTCAIMIELIQGEGGVMALDEAFVKAIESICTQNDILLIVDEVQTGIGRTGKLFAFEHFGIMPDILTSAKGLGGGLPIGAVLFAEKAANTLSAGTHGSTFGANPICCAGAQYILDNITHDLLREVEHNGKYIRERLLKMKNVNDVSGIGLMIGVDILPHSARDIAEKCLQKGLMILTAKDKIRFLPPLNIKAQHIERGLMILEKVLNNL